MKKINDWVIRTFGLRGSWSWAKKQMLNGAIIKRKATIGTYKIAIDNDKNKLLVATWDHLDQSSVWERCPHSLLDEDAVDYFVTAHKEFFCFSDIVKHLRKETKGKVLFLGENVRMRDEHRWVITEELGVEPVEIDSALVSAQTRHRLYWCNWPVEMPKDKYISLDDILEHDKGWNPGAIRGRYIGTIVGRRIGEDGYRKDCGKDIKITQCLEIRKDKNTTPIKKSNCLTTAMKDNVISSLPPGRYPNAFDMKDKFRYLTPVEMCRLQTLPDDYLDGIAPNTAMSLAGNGWTVDVIAHLLRSIERKQINDIVKEFRKITDELMFGSLETDIM